MIRIVEILAIVGLTGISFIGIVIARGGKKSAIAISILVSIFLIIFNEKLNDETGKGIVGNIYCSAIQCKSGSPSTQNAFNDPVPVPPGPSCTEEIAAWNVRLADFRSQESQRIQQCNNLESDQVALNTEFFELKTEWPLAMSFMSDCVKKNKERKNDSPLTCMDAVCFGSALGGYDCDPLQNKLRDIYNRQEDYLRRFRSASCSMNANSDYFDAMGMSYTKPVSLPPSPPSAPSCLPSG